MRLDRFIANATGLSRSQVHRAIKSGTALLNGGIARNNSPVGDTDQVSLNGEAITPAAHVYIALHKPAGYICANTDSEHPTVLDLLGDSEVAQHPTEPLQIAGRLDIDTTGLVLLTTDGQWNHKVTSANGRCFKTYEVSLAEPIADTDLQHLQTGVMLRSEDKPTRPCTIDRRSQTEVTITLSEGKYHQVKRMFASVGNRVMALHRRAIGSISLTEELDEGSFRALTAAEVDSLQ